MHYTEKVFHVFSLRYEPRHVVAVFKLDDINLAGR